MRLSGGWLHPLYGPGVPPKAGPPPRRPAPPPAGAGGGFGSIVSLLRSPSLTSSVACLMSRCDVPATSHVRNLSVSACRVVDLAEHVGLRQQLPDLDVQVRAHFPAAAVQDDRVVDGRERMHRIEIGREAAGRLRMARWQSPAATLRLPITLAPALPRTACPAAVKMSYDSASPMTVPPSVTSSDA